MIASLSQSANGKYIRIVVAGRFSLEDLLTVASDLEARGDPALAALPRLWDIREASLSDFDIQAIIQFTSERRSNPVLSKSNNLFILHSPGIHAIIAKLTVSVYTKNHDSSFKMSIGVDEDEAVAWLESRYDQMQKDD